VLNGCLNAYQEAALVWHLDLEGRVLQTFGRYTDIEHLLNLVRARVQLQAYCAGVRSAFSQ